MSLLDMHFSEFSGEHRHISSAQQLLHAFSESPSSVVLLTTALGEILGVLARQQRSIDDMVNTIKAVKKEYMQELSAVSYNFADILHDTIKRTSSAINEIRDNISKQQYTSSSELILDSKSMDIKREVADLRKIVLERLQQPTMSTDMIEQTADLCTQVASVRTELRDATTQMHILLELLDLRKTLLRHGYTGDPIVDLQRVRSLDTVAKVRLVHKFPCFHVLASALATSGNQVNGEIVFDPLG
ncbi:uncharacterized protein TM35_000074870 [Trypanosoma theileri]|uniref:Uncharacterized protein n=1 Tax=Trypanosoma theileri TaxID=67003 RepID=A0A1X0P2Z2_9TRYP|nr:uncharacterized protein TM35_000074870 [Trypanosoma theileri]ORC91063.1 hypothetical protein TM35_000074870 [Trypanosoma theileri]